MEVIVSFLPGPSSRAPSAIFVNPDMPSTDLPLRGMLRHHLTLVGRDGRTIMADEQVEPLETSPETHDEVAYYRPPRDKQAAAALDAAAQRISKSGNAHGDAWPAFVQGRQGALEFASEYRADESLLSFFASPNFPALWHLKEQYRRIRLYRNWSFGPDSGSREPCSAHARSDFLDEGAGNLPLVLSQLHGTQRKTFLTALDKLFDGIVDVQCPVTGGTVSLFLDEAGGRSIPASGRSISSCTIPGGLERFPRIRGLGRQSEDRPGRRARTDLQPFRCRAGVRPSRRNCAAAGRQRGSGCPGSHGLGAPAHPRRLDAARRVG